MNAPTTAPPSSDVENEQVLLGRAFIDPDDRLRITAECTVDLFSEPLHRRIFDALCELGTENTEPTDEVMSARLKGDPGLIAIMMAGGGNYFRLLRVRGLQVDDAGGLIAALSVAAKSRAALHALGYDSLTAEPRRFKVRDASPRDTPLSHPYLIKGLLAPGEMSVWYGEPGSGKSFVAMHAAYAVAQGESVFGRRVTIAPTLYVALEGERGFEKRLEALIRKRGPSVDFHYIAEGADFFGEPSDVAALITAAMETGAGLIVIDTLARSLGGGSENDGRDMNQIITAFDTVRRATGAHIAIVHHCGKDSTRGMRGHSSLLGAADASVEISRNGDGDRSLRIAKAKDDVDGDCYAFGLEMVELGRDQDGDVITSCVVIEEGRTGAAVRRKKVSGAAGVALTLLETAIAEKGEPAPNGTKIPRTNRTTTIATWRAYCDSGTIAESDKPDTQRKAFVRASKALQSQGLIGVWGDFVWIV